MLHETIHSSQWASVLGAFSHQHHGWLVSVELMYRENEGQPIAQDVPLMGVSYEEGDGVRILLGEQFGRHVGHLIPDPTGLDALVADDGSYEGLQFQAGDGSTTALLLGTLVGPETPDRAGPGRKA